jgi:hypothetical protein
MCNHVERAASLWEKLSAHTISDADALPLPLSTQQNWKQSFL